MLIGTIIKKMGYGVDIIDAAYFEDWEAQLCDYLQRNSKDLLFVGFSIMTTQIHFLLQAAKTVKNYDKSLTTVCGGVHPTLFPEQTLENENIDIVVINEGGKTIINLAEALSQLNDIETVKGIAYKKNNEVIFTGVSDRDDINELPFFDFSLIKVDNYLKPENVSIYKREFPYFKEEIKVMPILSGLGCAYKCQFCINVILKRRYRWRKAKEIIEEIKMLQSQYGANTFLFLDEDFFINKRRVYEFINLAEQENLHFNWRMWCRVDHFKQDYMNAELLNRLNGIGHGSLVMGGESANIEVLNSLDKGITPEQIINSLLVIKETKIFPRYSFMVGLENETMEQIRNTYRFCIKMLEIESRTDIAGPFIFRLYPGSPIYNRMVSNYHFNVPAKLEDWAEVAEIFTEMPWVPGEFQKIIPQLVFYSTHAFYNIKYMEGRSVKYIVRKILQKLSLYRLKTFIFIFPFEFWMYHFVKRLLKRIG